MAQQNDNQSKAIALDNIAITGMGLNCVTGGEPIALFGAVGTHLGYTQPDPVLEAPALDGDGVESVMTCAMIDIDDEDPHDRFMSCLIPALIDAIDTAKLFERPRKNALFYLVLPSSDTPRGDCLQMDEFHTFLQNELAELGDVELRIKTSNECVTEHLMFVSEALQDEQWDAVIFGAVDSLVDELTCMQLGKDFRIQTTETADGVIPGEAAGFLVLEKLDKIRNIDELPIAWLKGMSVQPEPNASQGDLKRLNGLSQAVRSVLATCGIIQEKINTLVLPLGTEQTDMIEWHQTETALWPHKASEAEMAALQLGEVDMIDPLPPTIPEKLSMSLSLGDVGVASLPVGIILAAARFEFNYPISKRIFILESGETPFRGAVYVKHPTNGKQINRLMEDAA
ncbi:hypothetical protein MNBD_GAMMA21-2120 [hydrothermal vent metagenome]|uniref:Uncharacterized protein n=1 Tax=hydrothermal vent metagenome TaxID=652676 RepID=A0A3B0ZYV9_9ZZZZ